MAAEDGFLIGRRAAQKTGLVVNRALGLLPREPQIKRRKHADVPDGDELTSSDSGCCCRETECLKHSDPTITTPIKPQFYAFRMTAFRCNCDPTWSAGASVGSNIDPIKLYETAADPDIWESDIRQCFGTLETTVNCTVTATWVWTENNCADLGTCPGSCLYRFSGTPLAWRVITFGCTGGVPGCSACVACGVPEGGFPLNPNEGDEVTTPCQPPEPVNPVPPHWELVGVDDPDCNCTPAQPDYDGTTNGQTATTTCDGTKVIDATGTLVDSFWRLTIVDTRDYYGCYGTKLEFFIGTDVVLTYYLTGQCGNVRGFCRQCANSFTIFTCGPTQCDIEPEPKICLAPKIADGDYTLGSVGCCYQSTAPATWKVTISGATGYCASLVNGTHYLGEIVAADQKWLVASLGEAAWAYYHFGDRNGFYASADDIPFCDPVYPCGFYGIVLSCQGGGMVLTVHELYNTQGVDPDYGPGASCIGGISWYTQFANDCDSPETITWHENGSTGATVTIEKYVAP